MENCFSRKKSAYNFTLTERPNTDKYYTFKNYSSSYHSLRLTI